MSASDDFKAELQKEDFSIDNVRQAIQTALSEAIELQITTWVVPADAEHVEDTPQPGQRMRTRINIVDGDIDNEVGSLFLGDGPYSELRKFHLNQVSEGREIIQQNLENLQQLFGVIVNNLQRLVPSRRSRSDSPQGLPPANS